MRSEKQICIQELYTLTLHDTGFQKQIYGGPHA